MRRALTRELTRVSVRANVGAPYQPSRVVRKITRWLSDEKLGGVIQHQTRSHMPSDLLRYFFAACSAKETKTSPRLRDFPPALLPNHRNAQQGHAGTLGSVAMDFETDFAFRAQRPATTIMSHISKGRSLLYPRTIPHNVYNSTVREAARIQTFPDTYYFEGKFNAAVSSSWQRCPTSPRIEACECCPAMRSGELFRP